MKFQELAEQNAVYALRIMELERRIDRLLVQGTPDIAPGWVGIPSVEWVAIMGHNVIDHADLSAAAPELLASLTETLTVLEQHLDDECAIKKTTRDQLCPCNQNEVARARALLARLNAGKPA